MNLSMISWLNSFIWNHSEWATNISLLDFFYSSEWLSPKQQLPLFAVSSLLVLSSCTTAAWQHFSPLERNTVRWDWRQKWNFLLFCWTVLNTKFGNSRVINNTSVLTWWKFQYKQSLMPNSLKWIQLYSSHSVLCPMFLWKVNTASCLCDCKQMIFFISNNSTLK